MIMTELEWSIFGSGVAVGIVTARLVVHAFWWVTFDRRYNRRH